MAMLGLYFLLTHGSFQLNAWYIIVHIILREFTELDKYAVCFAEDRVDGFDTNALYPSWMCYTSPRSSIKNLKIRVLSYFYVTGH